MRYFVVWYPGSSWAIVLSSSEDMVLSHAQNFVTIQNTNYKVLAQRAIWKIWCIDMNERQQTDIGRRLDECRTEAEQRFDGSWTDIGWNGRMIGRLNEKMTKW
jgi:hypothetical protein